MYKIIALCILFLLLLLQCLSANKFVHAFEESSKYKYASEYEKSINNINSCTERCHVNYMAYENEFGSPESVELFRHETHSFGQDLDCSACHQEIEVNTEGHGKLTIDQKNCLQCHHIELEDLECKRCHTDIDANPMKYNDERFVHGFGVESDVDCGLCHVKDNNVSLKNEINCVQCHHTTPFLDCLQCHKEDIDQSFYTDPQRKNTLSWTISFNHSQHPEQDLSCEKCHTITGKNKAGILEYNLNCSECHHVSEEEVDCIKCHEEPFAYLKGEVDIEEFGTMPDMMSRAVMCKDCHEYDKKKLKYKGVKEYCVECHNGYYGKLHDAWTNTITDRLKKLNNSLLSIGEEYQFPYIKGMGNENDDNMGGKIQPSLDAFIEKTGKIVDIIKKYGVHNFNLTRLLLDYMEDKTDYITNRNNQELKRDYSAENDGLELKKIKGGQISYSQPLDS